MFCHSCGAKNVDGSRFCNMCGGKLSAPPASLDQTQLGVGTSPELERVIERQHPQESFGFPLFTLVSFELWCRTFLDAPLSAAEGERATGTR